ncbi:MAG: isopeptide-forming domain-containing fimbrial protein [Lachnospiraceae bacterium]|nr:isopeptide-forming domain-containing fimbrial protein [Lachnospiraceae bacterium]
MKMFKKVTAFFLAAVMVLAMNCTVFAAEVPELPEAPESPKPQEAQVLEHEYTAYQIFSGTEVTDKGELLGIDWGTGINAEEFLEKLKSSTEFNDADGKNPFADIEYKDPNTNTTTKSADAVARVITNWESDDINGSELNAASEDGRARAFARIADSCKNEGAVATTGERLDAGYYLVVDTQKDLTGENAVRNLSFLQMGDGREFTPVNKTDVPELEKKVKEINDSDVTIIDQWGDVADYDLGDEVEFMLTGTLPTDYDSYETYRYVFHDKLSPGLVLVTGDDAINVEIVNQGKDPVRLNPGDEFKIGGSTDKESFTVEIEDLKKLNGTRDIVINANTKIVVTYKATLDGGENGANVIIGGAGNENKAWLEYSNDPNHRGEGEPPTGNTPEDKVVVFTYQLLPNKVDENGEALEGAGFSLFKFNGVTNAYEPVEIKGVTTEKKDSNGNIYYEIENVTTFEFKGVDAGKYKLVETTVPAGYNKAEDMYFDVVAELDETNQKIIKLEIAKVYDEKGNEILGSDGKTPVYTFGEMNESGNGNLTDGSLSTSIVNLKGIVLPSTGGIGTTIFYIIGGILVVGAGVLLVTRKRMSKTE